MKKKIFQCLLISAGIVFFRTEKSFSQIVFPDSTSVERKFSPAIYNFNYLRDYEYFSPIEEGYTLFGTIVHPTLEYKFSKHISFNGGIYFQENFGSDSFRVRPTFLLKLGNKKNHDFRRIARFNGRVRYTQTRHSIIIYTHLYAGRHPHPDQS